MINTISPASSSPPAESVSAELKPGEPIPAAEAGHRAPVEILSFYHFCPIATNQLPALTSEIEERARAEKILGLLIMGPEGVNATLSGQNENLQTFICWLKSHLGLGEFTIKTATALKHPFFKFRVKQRAEIVTLGAPDLVPEPNDSSRRLSPEEWHRVLTEDRDVVLIDTRNWYETRIGKFKGAIEPGTDEFREFPDFLRACEVPKDKKTLIYCTGGIRCEKAILEMQRQGFSDVWHLDGGILAYLEKFPGAEFSGECFVFDHRVAVDQELKPTSRFILCPHCGQPADQRISCVRCDSAARVCIQCFSGTSRHTCSKNCAHHEALTPGRKGTPSKRRVI